MCTHAMLTRLYFIIKYKKLLIKYAAHIIRNNITAIIDLIK